jgi:hypothetical protein
MSRQPIDITGGDSVYCINTAQLRQAYEMISGDCESSARLHAQLDVLEADFNRNDRAALAFLIIDRLLKSPK